MLTVLVLSSKGRIKTKAHTERLKEIILFMVYLAERIDSVTQNQKQ